MIKEFEQVILTADIDAFGLRAGDVGTVVDITSSGNHYTLEFFNFSGETVAVVPVRADQVRPLSPDTVMHARDRHA